MPWPSATRILPHSLGLDPARDANPKGLGLRIEEHQAPAFRVRRGDGNLEHALEELVGFDREFDGFDDFLERLEEFGFLISRRDVIAPEQSCGEWGDDLPTRILRALRLPSEIPGCIDDRIELVRVEEGLRLIDEVRPDLLREGGAHLARSSRRGGEISVENLHDLEVRVLGQKREQPERFVGGSPDAQPAAHQSPPGRSSESSRSESTTGRVCPSSSPRTRGS